MCVCLFDYFLFIRIVVVVVVEEEEEKKQPLTPSQINSLAIYLLVCLFDFVM